MDKIPLLFGSSLSILYAIILLFGPVVIIILFIKRYLNDHPRYAADVRRDREIPLSPTVVQLIGAVVLIVAATMFNPFVGAVLANLAFDVFIILAIRRYLEDHPKGGPANHRHGGK
jgi:hypothetical protein